MTTIAELSFEAAMTELERVVAALEKGDVPLEESIKLYERGAALMLGARYIPVGRVAVNISAGAFRYPWRRFLPLSVLAGLGWSALSLAIGLLSGKWLEDQPIVGAAIGVAIAVTLGVVIDRCAAVRCRRAATTVLAG